MSWAKIPGIQGLFYEPEPQPASERKHHCEDCRYCQRCGNTRCAACRQEKAPLPPSCRKKAEQTEPGKT